MILNGKGSSGIFFCLFRFTEFFNIVVEANKTAEMNKLYLTFVVVVICICCYIIIIIIVIIIINCFSVGTLISCLNGGLGHYKLTNDSLESFTKVVNRWTIKT